MAAAARADDSNEALPLRHSPEGAGATHHRHMAGTSERRASAPRSPRVCAPRGLTRRAVLAGSSAAIASMALAGCAPAQRAPTAIARSSRDVLHVVRGLPTSDGAGVRLTRVIGQRALDHLDPFLLLDQLHSDDPSGYIRGFPDHPHRGFETVTIMLDGRMRHRDSVGSSGLITGGGVQWMTAGRGIIHSEMPEQEDGMLWGFQLWVNLPRHEKMRAPEYQDLAPSRLAEAALPHGGRLRIAAGRAMDLEGPVRERATAPLLATIALRDEAPVSIEVPRDHTALVLVAQGAIDAGPERRTTRVGAEQMAIFDAGERIEVRAREERTQLVLAAARPLREPIARWGPFVMSTDAEIQQAIDDYRSGRLTDG